MYYYSFAFNISKIRNHQIGNAIYASDNPATDNDFKDHVKKFYAGTNQNNKVEISKLKKMDEKEYNRLKNNVKSSLYIS